MQPRISNASVALHVFLFFFFQAEDGIRDLTVTGVQTCALPISVALLKTLGATRAFTLAMSVLQLLALALLAAVAGAALGFLAQEWLLRTIRGLLAVTDLPAASLSPLAIGFVTAIALLAGFALPPLLQLARVSALRGARPGLGPPPPPVVLGFGSAGTPGVLPIFWGGAGGETFLFSTPPPP